MRPMESLALTQWPRLASRVFFCCLALSAVLPARGGLAWKVRVEEPTGLYRRTDEIVREIRTLLEN